MPSHTLKPAAEQRLRDLAVEVLTQNDLGQSTKPAPRLYPHQWLWDSCFIAIGLRHLNPERAQQEILSLFRGQWQNGLMPNVIFSDNVAYHAGPDMWKSASVPGSPAQVQTSCITQPPMIAEATVRVGECLPSAQRRAFYRDVLPGLLRYHEWLYRERDPEKTGLVTLIHPWEAGNEDTPAWSQVMRRAAPRRVKVFRAIKQEDVLNRWRPDLVHAPAEERPSAADFFTLYHLQHRMRSYGYDLARIQKQARTIPLLQDVLFNAILVRANQQLQAIAADIDAKIPATLQKSLDKAPQALETLYADGQYWSRNFRTGELVKTPSISGLVTLYAGTIPPEHADKLAALVASKVFWPKYGVASTPTDSPYFRPRGFWQGPIWVNMNWLLADGLERYGHIRLAQRLRHQTLELVDNAGGMYETFSALDGKGGGTNMFSWTAALVLDMLANK